MDGTPESPQMAALIPKIDLDARVVYFPVRHNSPACAWHISRLIEQLRPDNVLIEGPRDATDLIPLLTHENTKMPVAIYTTYVKRQNDGSPSRHAAYYPLCDYSPELAAIRAAHKIGASAEFIDLTFPEMVEASQEWPDDHIQSLLDERYIKQSRFLQSACQQAGLRDPDDLWDHLYESDYTNLETADFMRNVAAYCALTRCEYSPEMLAAEGCTAREQAMAAAIAEKNGKTLVVTGGFHMVALPETKPDMPRKVKVSSDDAQVVLVRYGFEQLDRLNGYASGMPSPEFYQRLWEGQDAARIIVELGRELREKGGDVSAEDKVSALAHSKRLAGLRGHVRPSREDLLDGIRSVFIKGSVDVEGVFVLSVARKLMAGDRIGNVPEEAGQPPIVADFRTTASRLKISLEADQPRSVTLDIYRKAAHREISRFFHRLRFLEAPFGQWVRGPDFVTGENLDRVQEVWEYRWSPACESTLIERSLYGPTLQEAASALLLKTFDDAEKEGQGRRADIAAALLVEACRMGLHKHTPDLLNRTARLIAEDSSFISLVRALTSVLLLHTSREPLEAHHLNGLPELALQAYDRACYVLPSLAAVPENEEDEALDALNSLSLVPDQISDLPEYKERLWERLEQLISIPEGSAAIKGGASGLLYGDGRLAIDDLVTRLRGHLLGTQDKGAQGVRFLHGLMRTARSILWQSPEVIGSVSELLSEWDEETFIEQLPALRLAFSDLTPRECDRVAKAVAVGLGTERFDLTMLSEYSETEMLAAVKIDKLVRESLKHDGLEEWVYLGKELGER